MVKSGLAEFTFAIGVQGKSFLRKGIHLMQFIENVFDNQQVYLQFKPSLARVAPLQAQQMRFEVDLM